MANAKKNLDKIQKKLKLAALKKDVTALKGANLIKSSFQLNDKNYGAFSQFLANVLSDQQSDRKAAKSSSGDFVNGTLDAKSFIEAAKQAEGVSVTMKVMATEASSAEDEEAGEQKPEEVVEVEDEIEEEDDGEPLIDPKQLKKFMKMSKNRGHPFACGLGADGLAYSMNKPAKKPKALAKNIKTATGATKLCFGMATLEGKILVLDLDPQKKPLPGLLRKMKKWLKENKPLPANKVRLMQGGEEVSLSPEEFLEILADYEAIVPGVLSSGVGDTQKIRAVWAFVNEKANAKDFAAARKGLAALDDLLDPVEDTSGTTPEASPTTDNPADQFQARLKALIPQIKQAAKTPAGNEAKLKASEAGMFAKKKDFDKANALLDEIETLLKAKTSSAPEVDWPTVKTIWQDASDTVDSQIAKLQSALRNSGNETLAEIAEFGLNAVTGNFKVPLMAAIREVDSGTGEARLKAAKKLLGIVQGFRNHIENVEQKKVAVVDDNPFGVNVSIQSTLSNAFDKMEGALQAMAA